MHQVSRLLALCSPKQLDAIISAPARAHGSSTSGLLDGRLPFCVRLASRRHGRAAAVGDVMSVVMQRERVQHLSLLSLAVLVRTLQVCDRCACLVRCGV